MRAIKPNLRFAIRAGLACVLLAPGLPCARAFAQDASSQSRIEIARETARQGLQALDQHDYASADDLLSRALSMHDAPTLRLARARARRALGRLLAAAEDFRGAANWAAKPDEPKAFSAARADAAAELAQLETQIPQLTVEVQGGQGQVRVAGIEWPLASLSHPRWLDPGDYWVEGIGTEGQVARTRVRLTAGDRQIAKLDLRAPAARGDAAAPMPQANAAVPAASPAERRAPSPREVAHEEQRRAPAPAVPPPTESRSDYTAAYVVGGISAALLIASVVTGVMTLNKRARFDERNANPNVPESEKRRLRSEGQSIATLNTILVGATVVGAGVTTGLVLHQASGDEERPAQAALAGPRLGVYASVSSRF